jgi:hypothetical protein
LKTRRDQDAVERLLAVIAFLGMCASMSQYYGLGKDVVLMMEEK